MLSSISPARFYPPLSTGCPSKQGTRPPHRCCLPLHQANCPLMLTASVRAAPRVAPLRSIPSTFGRGPCPPTSSWRSSRSPWSRRTGSTPCRRASFRRRECLENSGDRRSKRAQELPSKEPHKKPVQLLLFWKVAAPQWSSLRLR